MIQWTFIVASIMLPCVDQQGLVSTEMYATETEEAKHQSSYRGSGPNFSN